MADRTLYRDDNLKTLHAAVLADNIDAVIKYIALGVNLNALDSHGLAPMHYAVMKNSILIVKLLLDAEADIEVRSEPCNNTNCLEAMRCILLEKTTGSLEAVYETDAIRDYFLQPRQLRGTDNMKNRLDF